MRVAVSLLTLLVLLPTINLGQEAQSSSSKTQQNLNIPPDQMAISGCLSGKPDSYLLTEENGTQHSLMAPNVALSNYVGNEVRLVGYRDADRDASASSDEGTAHGLRFFRVESVASDSGRCHNR